MIDVHVHLLPEVDDGAKDMDEALEMAALAVESGVSVICVTPHSSAYGRHRNHDDEAYRDAVSGLQKAIDQQGLKLKLVPGMEIFGTHDVIDCLKKGQLIGLNHSRYPLVEFPFDEYAAEATEILEEIVALGMVPVVAHPERYVYVQSDPRLMNLWTDLGCLFQINKGSLLGRFGSRVQRLAWELVYRGFACVVASDAHSSDHRSTWMKEIRAVLSEELSKSEMDQLLRVRPGMLIENKEIVMSEPEWF